MRRAGTKRTRCAKCGVVDWTPKRQRRCRVKRIAGGYWCYGQLQPAPLQTPKKRPRPGSAVVTLAKLRQAIDKVQELDARIGRLERTRARWLRKQKYYQRRQDAIELLEQQRLALEAEQATRLERAPVTRAYFEESAT